LALADNPKHQPTAPSDLSRAMLELKQHAVQTKASSKVFKHIDQSLGTRFDERA
jgi:hypothetical protein